MASNPSSSGAPSDSKPLPPWLDLSQAFNDTFNQGVNAPIPTTDLSNYGANPYSSVLQQAMEGMTSPVASFTPQAYQAKDESSVPLPEYDAMRQRLNMQYSQGQQQAQDSLDRQFAASGGGPGNGAQAKQTENLATSIGKQKDEDLLNVQAQEAQERSRLREEQQQQAYQSGENVQNLNFQKASLGQEFAEFGIGEKNTIANLNTAWDNSTAEAANNAFNAELSNYQSKHSGGLLGAGGLLGTGLFG